MSMEIDQRVVEMQFDNKHFESNVSTTMSTLDKLKQKLHLPGAAKGLEDVGNAAKKVDMNGLSNGVENVRMKFSAMQVMGITALTNITNQAVNAGKRIVSALTIDPVKAGLQEYETQINATQTILANTKSKGSTIDDVNKALEDLNAYADMTIYNFTEMTRNIGTFTAAGVDLETSVGAIQGIANLAAISGSTSQQASTAMYQLSQALSSGTVKLMDWNSVVNAGMGGEVFQTALKKTSEQLGTGAEAAIKASGSFRESLKDGWLTADVLTETLKKFTTSGANEYLAEYTGLSQDVVENYVKQGKEAAAAAAAAGELKEGVTEEAYAIEHAAKAMAEKSGKNQKEIQDTLDLAQTATGAATEVKTFSQLWDVMKESAQSGWSQSWKIIIGDFEQAKKLLTPLANAITGFIGRMNDARNRMLEIAFNFTKPWTELSKKLKSVGKIGDAIKGAIAPLEKFQSVVNDVWMGKYNNWGDNPDRRDLLTAAGYDYRVVQELVNLGHGYKITAEDVAAAHKKYNITMEDAVMSANDVRAAYEAGTLTMQQLNAAHAAGAISLTEYRYYANSGKIATEELSDARLKEMGLTEEEIKLYRALEKEAKKQGKTINELAELMSEQTGRDRLISGLKNLGKAIGDVFSIAKDSYKEIFNPPGVEELGIRLFGVIYRFQEWTAKLRASLITVDKDGVSKLTDTGEKLKRTFKGIFAVFHTVYTVLSGPLKIAFNLIKGILSAFDIPILDFTAGLGDILVQLDELITGFLDFEAIGRKIGEFFKDFGKNMGGLWNSFKNSKIIQAAMPIFRAVGDAIMRMVNAVKQTEAFKTVTKFFQPFLDGIKSWWKGLKEAENIPKYLFEGLWKGITKGASLIWNGISTVIVKLIDIVCDILGIHSPSVVFMAIGGFIIAGLIAGITKAFPEVGKVFGGLFDKLTTILGEVDFGSILAVGFGVGATTAMHNVSKGFAGVGELMGSAGEFLTEVAPGVNKTLKGCGKFVKDAGKGLKAIGKGIKSDLKAEAFQKRMDGIMTLVKALVLLAAAVVILGKIATTEELIRGGITMGVLALVLIGMAWAVDKLSKASLSFDKAKGLDISGIKMSLIGIAAAMVLMAYALNILADMPLDHFGQGLFGLIALFGLMAGLFVIIGKTVKGEAAKNINKFGGMMIKISLALLLMIAVFKQVDSISQKELNAGLVFIAIFGVFVTGLTIISGFGGPGLDKMGGMMLKMSLALILMVAVFKLAAGLEPEEMAQGIKFLIIFGAFVLALVGIAKIGGVQSLKGLSGMLVGVSIAMLAMVLVMKIAGSIPTGVMIQGLIVIVIFGLLIKSLIQTCRSDMKIKGMMGTLLAVTIAIGILGVIATLLGLIDIWQLMKGVAAVGILAGMMSILITSLRGAAKVTGTIFAIAIAIAVMAAAVYVLAGLDGSKVAIATGAMSALMSVFTVVIKSTSKATKITGMLYAIAAVIAVMGGIVYLLSTMPVESVIGSAAALSVLLGTLAGVLLACSKIKSRTKTVMKAVGALALLGLVVAEIAVILGLMQLFDVNASIENVSALSVLISVMAAVLLVCSNIKVNKGKVMKSVGAMALLGLVVAEIAAILGIMQWLGISATIETAIALSTIMLAMSAACLITSKIPVSGAITGALGLDAFVAIVGALIAALGGLAQIPGFKELMAGGGEVMGLIGYAIGNFVGSIIGGLSAGVTSGLPKIGENLSAFIQNATPFIDAISKIDAKSMEGIGALADAILTITAADILNSLSSLFGGDSSLASFGKQLGQLGGDLRTFADSLGGFSDAEMATVTCAANAIKAMADAASQIPNEGGWLAAIVGDNSIGTWGAYLPDLGTYLHDFGTNLGTFSDDQVATVECAANAIKSLAAAAQEIPNEGGWLAAIVGDNSIGTWGAYLPDLGTYLHDFGTNLGTFSDDQVETVECAANAIKSLAIAAQEIPNEGGWLAAIVGDNSISTWGSYLPDLGANLAGFATNLGTFTPDQMASVECAAKTISAMAIAAQDIDGQAEWCKKLFGDDSIDTFASKLPDVGTYLSQFATNLGSFDTDKQATVMCAAQAIAAMAIASSGIDGQAEWCKVLFGDDSIDTFATRLPTVGEQLALFASALGTFGQNQVTTIACAANSIKAMAEASEHIDGQAGWCSALFGDDGIDTFAKRLPTVGEQLALFAGSLGTFEPDQVNTVKCAADAIKSMAEASTYIDGQAGWCSALFGDDGIDTFANRLPAVGAALSGFAEKLGKFDTEEQSTIRCAVKALCDLAALGEIDFEDVPVDLLKICVNLSKCADAIKTFIAKFPDTDSVNIAIRNLRNLLGAIKAIADVDADVLGEFAASLGFIGEDAVTSFINAFTSEDAKTSVKNAAKLLAQQAINGFEDKASAIEDAGKDLGAGLVKGIVSKYQAVYDAAYVLGQKAVQGEKDGQKSNSPSKLTMQSGRWFGEGLIIGIGQMGDKVYNAGYELGENATDSVSSSIAKIAEAINTDVDCDPVIRPVLDLSDIQSGVGTIGSLLSLNPSIDVSGNLSSITSMMNLKGQNGGNDDVVTELSKLRAELKNMNNTTYQINGVTYDDGSNVSNAVKTIVRYARIEGRV